MQSTDAKRPGADGAGIGLNRCSDSTTADHITASARQRQAVDPASAAIIRRADTSDLSDIAQLHARVFGPGRFARTAFRVREGTPPISPVCVVAHLEETLVGAVRMTEICIGAVDRCLMLGPMAVAQRLKNRGLGQRLLKDVAERSAAAGYRLIVLVGDEAYYGRAGYRLVRPGQIILPGPVDPNRLLALELIPGALEQVGGPVVRWD